MFKFTESQIIDATPNLVWTYLCDIKRWWLPSNPDHIELLVDDKNLHAGSVVRFKERVAGFPGEAKGKITEWESGRKVTWEGVATYHYLGVCVTIDEGVTWEILSRLGRTTLTATVWADFSGSLKGRMFEVWFLKLFRVIDRDREHARIELEYIKNAVESEARLVATS